MRVDVIALLGLAVVNPFCALGRIWLRSRWNIEGVVCFSDSFDGLVFTEIGDSCRLTWDSYRGDRMGLYTLNGTIDRGHADFSDFYYAIE